MYLDSSSCVTVPKTLIYMNILLSVMGNSIINFNYQHNDKYYIVPSDSSTVVYTNMSYAEIRKAEDKYGIVFPRK